MKEILKLLPQEILVGIIVLMAGGFAFLFKKLSELIKNQFEETEKRRENQFAELRADVTEINKKVNKISEDLDKNSEATNASLFNQLDNILRKAEITNVWSSTQSQQWWDMHERYKNLGDGLDEGKGLEIRAKKIEVDDIKYAENVTNYNKSKKQMIENI